MNIHKAEYAMASHHTLELLRARLHHEITHEICAPCTEQKAPIDFDDPVNCPCKCDKAEPFKIRLADLERALKISETYL